LYKILLLQHSPTINHIGSTAVPNIMSKPIVDILVEIVPGNDWQRAKTIMEKAGYICMASSYNRMSFNKGYTLKGYAEKVFHIHFHVFGDNDEIYFRDYLIANPIIACKYETLKLRLLSRYRNDRDKYTHAKSGFIKQITNLAKINNSRSDTSEMEHISGVISCRITTINSSMINRNFLLHQLDKYDCPDNINHPCGCSCNYRDVYCIFSYLSVYFYD